MASKFSYYFAPRAYSDLEEILNYMEYKLKNPKAAEDFTDNIFKQIDIIREFSESGREVENEYITDQSLRRFFVGNYVVFYKPDKKTRTIIIVRIVYGQRDIDEVIKTIN